MTHCGTLNEHDALHENDLTPDGAWPHVRSLLYHVPGRPVGRPAGPATGVFDSIRRRARVMSVVNHSRWNCAVPLPTAQQQ